MRIVEGRTHIADTDSFLASVGKLREETGATVQLFDSSYVVDRAHLERAVAIAQRERERGEAIARDEAVEILLYAAGRRQINSALAMGISAGEISLVGVVIGGDESEAVAGLQRLLTPAETLGTFDEALVCEFFDVTEREREATAGTLSDIIHERVALLVVER